MLAQLLASTDLVHLLLHLLWPHIRVRFAWTAPWVNASSGTTSILFLENTARESIRQRLQSGFLNGLQCPTFERLAVPSLSWLAPHVPVVGQAGRLWNVSLEEQGTLIPMEDIAERLGVDVFEGLVEEGSREPAPCSVNEIGESVLATDCAGSGFHSSIFPTCIEAHQQLAVSRAKTRHKSRQNYIKIFRIQVFLRLETLDRHVVAAGVTALCRVVMS